MRQSLGGFSSPLWKTDVGKDVARTLLASIPSGNQNIIDLRQAMLENMVGTGWCNKSWVLPTVAHPENILDPNIFGPRVIYVGKAVGWLQCTPWVNLCCVETIPDPHGGELDFEKYCSTRADLDDFLEPLFGCHLICGCKRDPKHCYTHHLVSLCDQMCHDKSVLPDHDTCAPFGSVNHEYQGYDDSQDGVNFFSKGN